MHTHLCSVTHTICELFSPENVIEIAGMTVFFPGTLHLCAFCVEIRLSLRHQPAPGWCRCPSSRPPTQPSCSPTGLRAGELLPSPSQPVPPEELSTLIAARQQCQQPQHVPPVPMWPWLCSCADPRPLLTGMDWEGRSKAPFARCEVHYSKPLPPASCSLAQVSAVTQRVHAACFTAGIPRWRTFLCHTTRSSPCPSLSLLAPGACQPLLSLCWVTFFTPALH